MSSHASWSFPKLLVNLFLWELVGAVLHCGGVNMRAVIEVKHSCLGEWWALSLGVLWRFADSACVASRSWFWDGQCASGCAGSGRDIVWQSVQASRQGERRRIGRGGRKRLGLVWPSRADSGNGRSGYDSCNCSSMGCCCGAHVNFPKKTSIRLSFLGSWRTHTPNPYLGRVPEGVTVSCQPCVLGPRGMFKNPNF